MIVQRNIRLERDGVGDLCSPLTFVTITNICDKKKRVFLKIMEKYNLMKNIYSKKHVNVHS